VIQVVNRNEVRVVDVDILPVGRFDFVFLNNFGDRGVDRELRSFALRSMRILIHVVYVLVESMAES